MISTTQPRAFLHAKATPAARWIAFLAVCLLMVSSAAAIPPAPKTVIVAPESDVIVEREDSTFGFVGTAVAVDSTVAAVEWRNNAGIWNSANRTDNWSFTVTDLVVGANVINVRSRNAEGTNSLVHTRTITRKPMWGITCDDPTVITENGFYEYDLTIFPRAWHRFTAPADGLVTVESMNRLGVGGCQPGSSTCGADLHHRNMPAPTRFLIYEGNTILLCSSKYQSNEPAVGGFSIVFEPADVQSQQTCETAKEITGPGEYHFTIGSQFSNPCYVRQIDPMFEPRDYYTVWYRFVAPQGGLYEFSLRQNPPILSEADFIVNQTFAYFTVFAGDTCPTSCSGRITVTHSYTDFALEATQGTAYLIAITNVHSDSYPAYFPRPGYGILDVVLGPSPPRGEICTEAIEITENGIHDFSNMDALLGDPCRTGSRTQWFTYTAPENGSVLVDTCGLTDLDTFVSAFAGDCPVSCGDRIVYNDDVAGPCGLQSRIEFAVQQGQTYKIALSGFATERGSSSFLFEFTPGSAPVIIGDIIGNGFVNVADVTMLARMIADGNAPSVEVADINGDGAVNELDVQALAQMIVD